jgi:hypothetical protein
MVVPSGLGGGDPDGVGVAGEHHRGAVVVGPDAGGAVGGGGEDRADCCGTAETCQIARRWPRRTRGGPGSASDQTRAVASSPALSRVAAVGGEGQAADRAGVTV